MKKLIIITLLIVGIVACKNEQRYTQQSPEIETIKALIKDYNNKDYEAFVTHYADTAKLQFNTVKFESPQEAADYHKNDDNAFSSRGILDENQDYEMVITDDNKTWVNFWGRWKGVLAANNKELIIPVHVTAQFVDGKIVEEYGYWDNSPIVLGLQEIEAQQKAKEMEMDEEEKDTN